MSEAACFKDNNVAAVSAMKGTGHTPPVAILALNASPLGEFGGPAQLVSKNQDGHQVDDVSEQGNHLLRYWLDMSVVVHLLRTLPSKLLKTHLFTLAYCL